ncbi:hypothetical protein ACF09Y_22290 [Streptomyces massasporeus]|uniref:DUF6197 family protein n=1 Tax=Streptomyces massasporeus TaxID=67324 RepID=UPI0036F94016
MTMTTVAAARPPQAATELDLDVRLALIDAAMSVRLDEAAIAFEVRTAYIPGAEPLPEITVPPVLPLTPAPCLYSTPLAALLHRARVRIETDGWCRDALVDEQGARCPIGAIRVEATSRDQADNACILLLDVIQQDFADATIPSWNAAQTSPTPVLHYLDRAAQHAHTRSL